ncbi:uncharacterized protein LOC121874508 [Homarus americanus]|uniref:uncharacterized protein LOC121874508 n=1 Tax=Homarus americanus TaxID=6706 RepID=UPI001C491856|nr:uncharacterized protein LOC121874508 [Homarus americanus]
MGGSGGCSGGAPLGFGSLGAGTVRILVGALVVFVVVIVVSLVVFWQAGCPKGGFQCSDGKCLPRSRWCNAEVDCDDQEDELEDECLLRQSTKPSEKTNFPKFSITFCHLCVCPLPYNVEDCLQPHINNKGIVQCNVTSNRGGLQAPHQPSKRSIRSVQTSDAKMSGAGKRRVDRTDKEDTIDRKNKTNDIERSEKQMLVDWGRQNSKHGLSKPFHYHNIFGSVEEPKCVRPNMRHEGKRIQEYGYLRKLPFKIGHLSYNRPFKRQHKSRVARDCKFAEHTNNIRNIYQQPTPRRLATRTQGVDHSNVFLNWKARTDSHTLRPLHTRSLELLFFKIPQNQTQTELTRPYQKKSKYTKAIELLYHRPILEGRIGLPDTPTKKYDQSLFQWKKKGRLHLMYDAVPGVVDQPKNTKASERGKRDLKVGVSRAGSGYSEGDRRFPHDKVPGHQQKEKHQKETHSGHQREEVYKTVVSYHHGDSNIGELNTGLFNNELVVYDYKTGDYDHKTGSYDQEKVIEQLKDMCYCELDTQLKCPHTGLAQVPHRIVGGITLLNIKGSEVFSLDAAVMSQYSTLTTL